VSPPRETALVSLTRVPRSDSGPDSWSIAGALSAKEKRLSSGFFLQFTLIQSPMWRPRLAWIWQTIKTISYLCGRMCLFSPTPAKIYFVSKAAPGRWNEQCTRRDLLACGRIEGWHGPSHRNRVLWPICGAKPRTGDGLIWFGYSTLWTTQRQRRITRTCKRLQPTMCLSDNRASMRWETFAAVFPRCSPVGAADVACCAVALDGQTFGAVTTVIHPACALTPFARKSSLGLG
jgi:hypothetical protein